MKKDYIEIGEHGLNPTILKHQCPICTLNFDKEIALLGRNRGKKAPIYTQAEMQICPDCQELIDKGYFYMVEIDEAKSTINGERIKLEDAYRTGRVAWIKKEAMPELDTSKHLCFCHNEFMDMILNLKESDNGKTNG